MTPLGSEKESERVSSTTFALHISPQTLRPIARLWPSPRVITPKCSLTAQHFWLSAFSAFLLIHTREHLRQRVDNTLCEQVSDFILPRHTTLSPFKCTKSHIEANCWTVSSCDDLVGKTSGLQEPASLRQWAEHNGLYTVTVQPLRNILLSISFRPRATVSFPPEEEV